MEGLLLGVHDKLCWCLYRLETNCLSRIILEKLLASISRSEGLEGDCLYNAATHSIVPPPQAVRLLESARLKDEIEEKQWKEVLLKLYLNQSLVSLKLNRHRLAVAQCKRALDIDPRNVKANFRLGQVSRGHSEWGIVQYRAHAILNLHVRV